VRGINKIKMKNTIKNTHRRRKKEQRESEKKKKN
jgi:hypothetical protein